MTERLRIERLLAASRPRVWAALTAPAELAAWMWPGSFATAAEVDLREGGHYRIASDVAGMAVLGEYVALDEPARLVQTWRWEGETEETLVTITLEEVEGGTALTIVHERFGAVEVRDDHLQGWNDCLDRLEPYVSPVIERSRDQ